MTPRTRLDPLDPAERRLADALQRSAPTPGPAPELDAAILAAARDAAAVTTTPAPALAAGSGTPAGHHRRRRTPAWLRGGAVAATLVIAVGVAWQLRPQFDAPGLSAGGAPTAATTHVPDGADPATSPEPAPSLRAPIAPAASQAPDMTAREAAAEKARGESRNAARSRAVAAPRHAAARPPADAPLQDAAPWDAPPQVTPPRNAPPVAAPPQDVPLQDASREGPRPSPASVRAPPVQAAVPPPREAAARPGAAAGVRADTADSAHVDTFAEDGHDEGRLDEPLDQPPENIPPASVESPAVREAWLARIRELIAAERYADARDSFAEFRRRHPDAPVPDDLRELLGDE